MKRLSFMAISLLVSVIFYSCSVEYDTANNYIERFSNKQEQNEIGEIYVALPKYVIHTNRTINEMEGFQNFSDKKKNEIITENTKFLDKINDSAIIAQFNEFFLYNLSRLGMPVIITTEEKLPQPVEGKIFTINVAQIEAEEFTFIGRLETYLRENEYYKKDIDLNGFSLNIWFSYNEKDTNMQKVYYKNFEIKDELYGDIFPDRDGKAEAIYKINKLNLNDIYYTSYIAGKMSATLFIEKWINEYVSSRVNNPTSYYFYDPKRNKIDGSARRSYLNKEYLFKEID